MTDCFALGVEKWARREKWLECANSWLRLFSHAVSDDGTCLDVCTSARLDRRYCNNAFYFIEHLETFSHLPIR